LKDARNSYKPTIFLDSGVLVNAYSEALGEEDWALAEGDAAGSGVKGVTAAVLRWRRGLEKVELQRKQDSRESFPGMTYSSIDQ